MFAFADNNYVPKTNFVLQNLIKDMEKSLEAITKWLRDSGLEVNQAKIDLCLFYKKDCNPVTISIGQARITSNKEINVLGVLFDSKLQWIPHINSAINH
jgi:hypothetical protein